MILKIRDGLIFNEFGVAIAVLTAQATPEEERAITLGAEATPFLENFVDQVNSGKFKPRTLVRTLESIIEKHSV